MITDKEERNLRGFLYINNIQYNLSKRIRLFGIEIYLHKRCKIRSQWKYRLGIEYFDRSFCLFFLFFYIEFYFPSKRKIPKDFFTRG